MTENKSGWTLKKMLYCIAKRNERYYVTMKFSRKTLPHGERLVLIYKTYVVELSLANIFLALTSNLFLRNESLNFLLMPVVNVCGKFNVGTASEVKSLSFFGFKPRRRFFIDCCMNLSSKCIEHILPVRCRHRSITLTNNYIHEYNI